MEPSTTRIITFEELAKHSTREDAWLSVRGKVFNVTDYVSSHPGGVSPISKGFGKDATSLFNAAHSYVDFEKILRGKQMGILEKPTSSSPKVVAAKSGLKGGSARDAYSSTSVKNSGCCCMCLKASPPKKDNIISFNEDDLKIFAEVTGTKADYANENDWMVSIIDKNAILIKHVMKPPNVWIASYVLNQTLTDDRIAVSYENNFQSMTVMLMKPEPGIRWKQLGTPTDDNDKVIDCRTAPEDMQEGVIIAKENLTHNVVRFSIELKPSVKLGVPLGFHVKLRLGNVQRRYTPVCYSLTGKEAPEAKNGGQIIYLAMKIYPDGEFTQLMNQVPIGVGNKLMIGDVGGSFSQHFFTDTGMIIYFAGGSGITPFIRILEAMITNKSLVKGKSIILIFFNHDEKDIILKSEFEEVASKYSWFSFHPVITCENSTWCGIHGKPTVDLIKNQIKYPACCASTKAKKVLICGSPGFNQCCKELVESLPFPTKDTWIFEG